MRRDSGSRGSSAPRPMATSSSPTAPRERSWCCAEARRTATPSSPAPSPAASTTPSASRSIRWARSRSWVYIANTTSVVRFAYTPGDLVATAKPETIVPVLPGYAQLRGGGHWTRDVAFSLDGKRMWISVGSGSNVDDADTHPNEFHRADILECTPEGKFVKVYASGLRNCVGEAVNPITGQLWCSTNERDALGNNLVPDYITSVPENGFFGWPWYYMGGHQDPRLPKPCANGTGPTRS